MPSGKGKPCCRGTELRLRPIACRLRAAGLLVVAAGPDVAGFEIRDRGGGVVFEDVYAEIVLADPRLVSHVPVEVDAAAALALVRGGLIALSTLQAGHV